MSKHSDAALNPQWCETLHHKAQLDWDATNVKQVEILNSVLGVVDVILKLSNSTPHLPIRITLPNLTNLLTVYNGHAVVAHTSTLRFNNIKRWRKLLAFILSDNGYSMFVDNTCRNTLYLLVELREIQCD